MKKADLHVHVLQSLYPEDLFEMAKNHYREINWNRFNFLDRYEEIFGIRLDPIAMFERAIETGSLGEIEETMVYKYNEYGNFNQFNIKSYFPLCITGYFFDKGDHVSVLRPIVDRHKRDGLSYVEYRHGFVFTYKEEWKEWHLKFARFFKEASDDAFQAKYIIRTSKEHYGVVKELITENPDLNDVIVGIDFSGREISPESLKDFYREVKKDQKTNSQNSVDVVVHIGENFFDKSLESAIRWCHQSALFGAKRLGHCIALGIDPEIAVDRQENAHEYESIEERIAQIRYDIENKKGLQKFGVKVDCSELEVELRSIENRNPNEQILKQYDKERLSEIKKRQDYVLWDLQRMGTIIETCPTSNLCIGGIPGMYAHPFKKLYDSGVNLAVCTDDPGIFMTSISDEIDFIMKNYNITEDELKSRLGDPLKFRLKS